ncbi:hypothetical protein KY290_005623 [Solanum tuberosum]|uniref:Endonuclease/exonuclease/phosphatase domain-containing protein n=1 Tax=Solanum tuberosum TaxID=4113 RepID=A0ABQ7WEN9_SOLTU|nr:hypothetical protein KY290_005623 [Solanum tuberosum]
MTIVAYCPQEMKRKGRDCRSKQGLQEQATSLNLMMDFIIWNARGVNNASFRRQCGAIVNIHKPALLVLQETKMTKHQSLTEELKFDSQIQSTANGLSGGIVIMWNEDTLKLENLSITPQGIHVTIKVLPNSPSCFFSTIYASPDFNTRTNLWKELGNLSKTITGEWLIGGDFIEVLHANDKLGGNSISYSKTSLF